MTAVTFTVPLATEWRVAKARAHVCSEQQHCLLSTYFITSDSCLEISELFMRISEWLHISPSLRHPNYLKGIWLEFWMTEKDLAFYWRCRLHSKQNSSSFAFRLPAHMSRGEAEGFHVPCTEPWERHDSTAPADSRLCYLVEPTELVITILLNKLRVLATQDTPHTSVHVGSIYLPAFLPPSCWQECSLSHGYTYGEAPVNALITNFIMRGNLLTLSNYLLTEFTLKHPVLKALSCFKLLSCQFSNPLDKVVVPSLAMLKSLVFSGVTKAYN